MSKIGRETQYTVTTPRPANRQGPPPALLHHLAPTDPVVLDIREGHGQRDKESSAPVCLWNLQVGQQDASDQDHFTKKYPPLRNREKNQKCLISDRQCLTSDQQFRKSCQIKMYPDSGTVQWGNSRNSRTIPKSVIFGIKSLFFMGEWKKKIHWLVIT